MILTLLFLFTNSKQESIIQPTDTVKTTLNSCVLQTNESRKYITHNEHFSGDWEYGKNASLIENDKALVLVPNLKNVSGYAWLTQRLPSEHWISNINLSFQKGFSSSTIGIWMTKDFGPTGEVFGGPSQFHGICILMHYNGTSIFTEIRENDGKEKFDELFFYPSSIEPFSSQNLLLTINYTSPYLSINITIDKNTKNIFNEKPRVKVRRHWFSITGQNNDKKPFYGNQIKVNSILFKGEKVQQIFKQIKFRKSNTSMPMISALSNNLNSSSLKNDFLVDAIEIIKCFDELIDFSSSLSTRNEVLFVVNDQVTTFSDKWQRRAISMTKKTEEIKVKIIQQLNNTENALKQVKDDLQVQLEDFRDDIHKIESDLYFKVLEGYKLSKQLKEERKIVKKGGIPKKLMYATIMEIAALALFFTLQSMNGHLHEF